LARSARRRAVARRTAGDRGEGVAGLRLAPAEGARRRGRDARHARPGLSLRARAGAARRGAVRAAARGGARGPLRGGRRREADRRDEPRSTRQRALALWRGPPRADVRDEPFARREAARLEELRLLAIETRVEAELALGEHAQAVAELEALTAEHPLRERLHG